VRLDEEVIGNTPLEHEFVHGGKRRLTLYLPGRRTWSQRVDLDGPWYSRFPLDLVTEVILPLGREHRFPFEVRLIPDTGAEPGSDAAITDFVERAVALRRAEAEPPEEPGEPPQ